MSNYIREWETAELTELTEEEVFANLETEGESGHAWADELEHVEGFYDAELPARQRTRRGNGSRLDWAARLTELTAHELGREFAESSAKMMNWDSRSPRLFTGGMLQAVAMAADGIPVGRAVGCGFKREAVNLAREARFFSCGKGRTGQSLDVGAVSVVSLEARPVEDCGEVDLADSPVDIACRNEAQAALWRAVAALPMRERRMVVGVHRLGMTVPQVARLLRVTKKAGYLIEARALARLRGVLER